MTGRVGQFMISSEYPAHSQLIHVLTFSLEQLAWIYHADYVVVHSSEVQDALDVLRELEYLRVYNGDKTQHIFLKYKQD